ncbi:hypothetical protein PRO82_002006 [Candidatus Protochlamydia amoebophila]|nr:hypothetical protein [Candidatus Protochlamydia amoebophila]
MANESLSTPSKKTINLDLKSFQTMEINQRSNNDILL